MYARQFRTETVSRLLRAALFGCFPVLGAAGGLLVRGHRRIRFRRIRGTVTRQGRRDRLVSRVCSAPVP